MPCPSSPRLMRQARSRSISRGACCGAPRDGKAIDLHVLHPRPPATGRLRGDACQSGVCPRSAACRSAPDAAEARILIRWLATAPPRQAACGAVRVRFPALCVCLRVCREGHGSTSGQKATWLVSCLGGLYHGAHHCPAKALSVTVFCLG